MLKFCYPVACRGKLKVFVQAGPYAGYLVAAKQIVKSDNLRVYFDGDGKTEIPASLVSSFFGTSVDTTIAARNDLHKFNVGIQGAAGFSYAIGRGKVFVEGGGNFGFLYIQEGDAHGKNNIGAGTVLLGYAFNLHGKKAS